MADKKKNKINLNKIKFTGNKLFIPVAYVTIVFMIIGFTCVIFQTPISMAYMTNEEIGVSDDFNQLFDVYPQLSDEDVLAALNDKQIRHYNSVVFRDHILAATNQLKEFHVTSNDYKIVYQDVLEDRGVEHADEIAASLVVLSGMDTMLRFENPESYRRNIIFQIGGTDDLTKQIAEGLLLICKLALNGVWAILFFVLSIGFIYLVVFKEKNLVTVSNLVSNCIMVPALFVGALSLGGSFLNMNVSRHSMGFTFMVETLIVSAVVLAIGISTMYWIPRIKLKKK